MAIEVNASINVLWQNLIALNASLFEESEAGKLRLSQTEKLLDMEKRKTEFLQVKNKLQKEELLKRERKIALLTSKIVAIKQITSHGLEEDDIGTGSSSTPSIRQTTSHGLEEDDIGTGSSSTPSIRQTTSHGLGEDGIGTGSSSTPSIRQTTSHGLGEDGIGAGSSSTPSPIIVSVGSIKLESDAETEVGQNVLLKNVCSECGKQLRTRGALTSHQRLHKPPTFPCPICSEKFPRSDYVKKHVKKAHSSAEGSGRTRRQ